MTEGLEKYREPYKDSVDRTETAKQECAKHIKEYLSEKGQAGYILGPTKLASIEGKTIMLGLAILDPQKGHPEELRFFVTPIRKLNFIPLKEDLIQIKDKEVEVEGDNRKYEFTITHDKDEIIPSIIKGTFSYGDIMLLDLDSE